MEEKTFVVTIKGYNKLSKNDYVRGVVRGIGYAMCGGKPEGDRANMYNKITGDYSMFFDCTEDEFKSFVRVVSQLYPYLCEFGYKDEFYES